MRPRVLTRLALWLLVAACWWMKGCTSGSCDGRVVQSNQRALESLSSLMSDLLNLTLRSTCPRERRPTAVLPPLIIGEFSAVHNSSVGILRSAERLATLVREVNLTKLRKLSELRDEKENSFLLVASHEVVALGVDGTWKRMVFSVPHLDMALEENATFSPIFEVSYDPVETQVYWSDTTGVYRKSLRGSESPQLFLNTTAVTAGHVSAELIAVDWLGRNLYVTNASSSSIMACSLRTAICATVMLDVKQPGALQLDLESRQIFWTDFGVSELIVAGMDGSNRTSVRSSVHGLEAPKAMSLDVAAKHVYLHDGLSNTAHQVSYDGRRSQILGEGVITHPYGMAVWKERLFWSDWQRNQVLSCKKTNCQRGRPLATDFNGTPNGISLYSPSLFKGVKNPCRNHSCRYLCLLSTDSPRGYVCACPDVKSDTACD